MNNKIKDVFFDLDHTLWDFAKNSKQTLKEAFLHFNLKDFNINFEDFLAEYFKINDAYWDDYRKGRVTKEQLRYGRFRQSLKHFNIVDEALIIKFADFYVEHSPQKKNVFPNTHETLDFLKNHLEPKCNILYKREAYRDETDNFRITFDHSLRISRFDENIDAESIKLIKDSMLIMEIKYEFFLPKEIKQIISLSILLIE